MTKVFTVAACEFGSAVRTKAFILGVLAMPLFMGVAIVLQLVLARHKDSDDRAFAVTSGAEEFVAVLSAKALERNRSLAKGGDEPTGAPRFIPIAVSADGKAPEALRLELSDKVRAEELFAFIEITGSPADLDRGKDASLRYYSDHPTDNDLYKWIREVLDDDIRRRRFAAAAIDRSLVEKLNRPLSAENLGLVEREAGTGEVTDAEKVDPFKSFGVPVVLMFLLFIVVMSSAPQLLNSVLEEKMSRISEVLIASVRPMDLMFGKLLGSACVSSLLAAIYIAGALIAAAKFGYADAVSPALFAWFVVFLVLSVLSFGSVFVAIGAACTEIKDTQNLMMPAMLVIMLPIFAWSAVLKAPASPLAVGLSLFPPATPTMMLLRLAVHPGPPAWQVALGLVLLVLWTVACVWAAGKIFRTGILMQGKSATLPELVRWLRA